LVTADNLAALEWFLAKDAWNTNGHGDDEEQGANSESFDPLNGDDDGEELGDTEGERENTKGESHDPVLEYEQVEATIDSPCPDEDVCDQSGSKMVAMHCGSTIPVESYEAPCQWSGNDSSMGKRCGLGITEVGNGELEEVDDDEQQSPPEVAAGP